LAVLAMAQGKAVEVAFNGKTDSAAEARTTMDSHWLSLFDFSCM